MASRLLYVMDPMCSWCWGFAPVVEALAEQAAVDGVPLQIVTGGLRRDQVAINAAARVRYLGYWQAVNASTGQLFDFERGLPEGMVYDTEPACRALVTARNLDASSAWTLLRLIQRAFYAQGADVTQASVLVELAERAGIPRIEFAKAFDSQAMHEATATDFTWVQDLGIAGFPTLLAERDGQLALLTNGYQPLDALSPLLSRWLERAAHA
ncbi:DsbA family protein [Pseudomonas wenzhouensis]|uniref:DsbA family protein n=1 Tax=Pseudomonas wenzhouensis TaxID=2906062 RepID=UPI001E3D67DA|nr:DsbA family protein [Pseudomonas wenzhouensis]UFQ96318.1 DsbA family protein [Pseudomonas wenzhouensis]